MVRLILDHNLEFVDRAIHYVKFPGYIGSNTQVEATIHVNVHVCRLVFKLGTRIPDKDIPVWHAVQQFWQQYAYVALSSAKGRIARVH